MMPAAPMKKNPYLLLGMRSVMHPASLSAGGYGVSDANVALTEQQGEATGAVNRQQGLLPLLPQQLISMLQKGVASARYP